MTRRTRTAALVGLGLALISAAALGADSSGKMVEESWEIARIDGAKVGFLHTTVQRIDVDGDKRFRAAAELDLTFKRYNTALRLRREYRTEETADGKVVGVFMRQGQEGGRQLMLAGKLEDGRMHVRIDDGRIERRLRWSDDVVGLYRLQHLFQRRKPKPDEHWTLERYDPTYNTVVTFRVVVKEREEVALSAGTPRAKLLRVELTANPLEVPGIKVQPPPEVWWLDERFMPVRRQFELEGLGTVVLTRTTRQAATAAATPARLTDIGLKTLIPLNRSLPRPYATRSVVYRVTLRGDRDPGSALVGDDHQDIRALHGNTFELHVHPVKPPPLTPNPSPPLGEEGGKKTPLSPLGGRGVGGEGDKKTPLSPLGGRGVGGEGGMSEYLESCHFINSSDAHVKELARRAVGAEKDAWAKAKLIERWVKRNMRVDNAVPLEPASEAARQLRGDCRQYALLTAALCRAVGVPSRTAVGLLYVEKGLRPLMGFHMWTEVWIDGQWLGLDATLGLGGVSAAHIKISDHSWHDTPSLTPLLPASRVLGKMTISVIRSESEP